MLPTPDAVRGLIAQLDLRAFEDHILSSLTPAIRMTGNARSPLRTGGSRLGGEPDLPSPQAWPTNKGRPLHFLAQIDLADCPRGWTPSLPERGRLWLWYDSIGLRIWNNNPDGDPATDGASSPGMLQVTFDPDPHASLARRPFPDFEVTLEMDIGDPWHPFPERPLALEPIHSLAQDAIRELMDAAVESKKQDEWRRAAEFLIRLHRETKEGNHRLLGGVDEVQSDMRRDCQALTAGISPYLLPSDPDYPKLEAIWREPADWILLAALDSDDAVGWCWGDAGTLCYFMRAEDLAQQRFEAVQGIWSQG